MTLIAVHHEYLTPLFEISVGQSAFIYDMHYDHDYMSGNFVNARVCDLTNYPFTHDPSKTPRASLRNIDSFSRYEIIGIRDQNSEREQGIFFDTYLYTD